MSKTKPKSKTKSSKPKKLIPDITAINLKVGIILLGIFFFVIGWIVYAVKKANLADSDRTTCKIVLCVFTILETLVIVTVTLLAIIDPHGLWFMIWHPKWFGL